MKIVFFGSSEFSCTILQALCEHGFCPQFVVTQPDKPKGRGLKVTPTEVSRFALKNRLAQAQPVSLKREEVGLRLSELEPEVFVVADYGKILPPALLNIPKKLPIAIHPSLLPRYRGPAPINWALINGDRETGVTIFKMNQTLDSGEILMQRSMTIRSGEDAVTLHATLAHEAGLLAVEALKAIGCSCFTLTAQDEAAATIARKLTKADGVMDWSVSAAQIRNKIRGTAGWPSMHARYHQRTVKILDTDALDERSSLEPATVARVDKKGIYVATHDGVLLIKKIQPEGKRPMDAWAFVVGHHVKAGDVFK